MKTVIEKKPVLQMYNLPKEVKFCKLCTISNQRPRITFNEQGICSACDFAEYKRTKIDWKKREEELVALLDKHRKNNGDFDVIVPTSGGKDAAYVSHELKHRYGMTPLTVTWAPHIYTDIGFQNIHEFSRKGNLYNLLATPPGKTHRELTKLSFEILGDGFQPFAYGQTNYPLQIAVNYNVPPM